MSSRRDPSAPLARLGAGIAAFALASCGAPAPPPTLPSSREPIAARSAERPSEIEPSPPAPSASPAAAPERKAPFPPPDFAAPFGRTKRAGDGVWQPVATGDAAPLLYRSVVHPHAVKPSVYVAVVAVDLERANLELVAGTVEPPAPPALADARLGLVAEADKPGLLAVFNGGFMAKHGNYGMMVDGAIFLPPRDEACTVALFRPDAAALRVQIATWPKLVSAQSSMRAFRQTPPCLLEDGALHPEIDSDARPRKWSASATGAYDVRRSALGLDATGTILFYGLGEWVTPHDLADAMKTAGAKVAAQLDINWSYTRFLVYGRPPPEKRLQVTETLIPKTKHTPFGYVEKASERDFFYLKRSPR